MDYNSFIQNAISYNGAYVTPFIATLPVKLYRTLNNETTCRINTYVSGRTFSQTLRSSEYLMRSAAVLCQLIQYLHPQHKPILIDCQYKTFTNDTPPQDLNSIIQNSTYTNYYGDANCTNSDCIRINILHIPRGYSLITNVLKTAEADNKITRLKNVELQLIKNPTHYVKVISNLTTDIPEYTIITNWIDTELLHKILLLFPVILGCKYYTTEEINKPENSEEIRKIYELESLIPMIYNVLYGFFTNTLTEDQTKASLKEYFEKIIALKGLNELNLNTFTNNLAKAINLKINKKLTDELNNLNNSISSYERSLTESYARKEVVTKQLALTSNATPEDVKPLIDTLQHTKPIKIIDGDERNLRLSVVAPLQFFVSSDFERYEKNHNSEYNNYYFGEDKQYTKAVFHKIFVTKEYKLLLSAIIDLSISTNNYDNTTLYVRAATYNDDTIKDLLTQMPNPHLYRFNCWDMTRNRIQKAIVEKEYELIPALIVNSVQTINVAENASFDYLLRWFTESYWRNKVTLINKDNQTLTWEEAIEIEKQQITEESKTTITATETTPIEATPVSTTRPTEYTQIVINENGDE